MYNYKVSFTGSKWNFYPVSDFREKNPRWKYFVIGLRGSLYYIPRNKTIYHLQNYFTDLECRLSLYLINQSCQLPEP